MSDTAWHCQLADSVHALKCAAITARNVHQHAVSDLETAQSDALRAQHPGTAADATTGRSLRPYTRTLNEITSSQQGLVLSTARVWYRAAHRYAYGVTEALSGLQHGGAPSHATVADSGTAVPALTLPASAREQYAAACEQETQIRTAFRTFSAIAWDRPAAAWHTYAASVDHLLWQEITSRTAVEAPVPGAAS